MTNGEEKLQEQELEGKGAIKRKTCHYCFKKFLKEDMLEDKGILKDDAKFYACIECFKNYQNSTEARVIYGARWVLGSCAFIIIVGLAVFLIGAFFFLVKESLQKKEEE